MKEKKLVWDLDGCLRDLSLHISNYFGIEYPKTWDVKHEGMTFFKMVEMSHGLLDAPPTEYFDLVLGKDVEIWTSQPLRWRENTKVWIAANFLANTPNVLFHDDIGHKRALLDVFPNIWLVEDNPNYENYDRIILIDRPYNTGVKTNYRVNSPEMLEKLWNSIR